MGTPCLDGLPGDHLSVPTDKMSCSACPSLPVVTVAGKTLLEVSAGETTVTLSVVSDT